MAEIILTDQTFDTEVMQSDKPVLVDFWAKWCGPCKVQSPIVAQLADEYEGKAKIGAMEVDEHPQTPQKYGILSIPTLMIFKGGKVVWQGVGLHRKDQIEKAINDQL